MKVSIVVPVYNVEKYVEKCIQSLLNQTYSDIEIVLIDDGSSDNSGEICKKWSSEKKVVYYRQPNAGVSAARNKGISLATGDYIMFVDSDDWVEQSYVETLVAQIAKGADFAYGVFCIDYANKKSITRRTPFNDGIYKLEDIYSVLFFGARNKGNTQISTSVCVGLFNAKIIRDKSIIFDTNVRYAEDWLFYASYCRFVNSISIVNTPIYHYVQRNGSAMNSFSPTSEAGLRKSLYIMERIEFFANHTHIEDRCFKIHIQERYKRVIVNQAKNVWDKRNKLKVKEKKEYLKKVLEIANISKKISDLPKSYLKFAITHECVGMISIYAIVYNKLRDIRNRIIKVKCS